MATDGNERQVYTRTQDIHKVHDQMTSVMHEIYHTGTMIVDAHFTSFVPVSPVFVVQPQLVVSFLQV
jgi:hypothetical protein